MTDVNVDEGDLDDLPEKIYEVIKRSREMATMDVVGNLSDEAPHDHGKLRGSFDAKRIDELNAHAVSSAEYAIVVSEGSDPYEIVPDEAEALVFEWPEGPEELTDDNDMAFFKRVQHPGIEGDGYIERAANQTRERSDDFVKRAMQRVGLI